ncbi:MAG: putative dsRNA-binding protein [Coprococcus sp.]
MQSLGNSTKNGKELKYVYRGEGPEHNKIFVSDAMIDGQATARGEGFKQKKLEQMAATKHCYN